MALGNSRNTSEYATPSRLIVPIEAATIVYLGSLCGLDASGYLVPAQSALIVLGRADSVYKGIPGQDGVNTSPTTSGAAGAISMEVKRGCFSWDINSSDITQANVGGTAYAVDDHTVSSSSNGGARAIAGRIVGLDASTGGVFVDSTEGTSGPGAGILTLSGAGNNGAGACTVAGTIVGQKVIAVFGAPTAGGALISKVPGTDFEATVSVAGQVQQLAATNLSADTFIFLLGTK